MQTHRRMFLLLVLGLALGALYPASAVAVTLVETFAHTLPAGTGPASYTHQIALPDDLAAQGCYFIKRSLALNGRLEIEREDLTGTGYFLRLRLPNGKAHPATGSIEVRLEADSLPYGTPNPDPPTGLQVLGEPARPVLAWEGQGEGAGVTLYDRSWNQTMWERVIPAGTRAHVTETRLLLHHRYLWAVKECNADGHYSEPAMGAFVIAARVDPCLPCKGTGSLPCPACSPTAGPAPAPSPVAASAASPTRSRAGVCLVCNGLGRVPCKPCRGSGKITVAEFRPDTLPSAGETMPGGPVVTPR